MWWLYIGFFRQRHTSAEIACRYWSREATAVRACTVHGFSEERVSGKFLVANGTCDKRLGKGAPARCAGPVRVQGKREVACRNGALAYKPG